MNRPILGPAGAAIATLRVRGFLVAALAWLASFTGPAFAQYAADGFDPDANGTVRSVVVQADGKILIGGDFTQVGGQVRNGVARLNADGRLDAGFNPDVTGSAGSAWVQAMAVQADGRILLGGGFAQVGGQPRQRLARLSADGSLDAAFNPGADFVVSSLVVQADGRILAGGAFTQMAGQARSRVARLFADGRLDASFNPGSGASDLVSSLAVQADGKVLAGGWFAQMAGQARYGLARLNADGSLDTGFNAGVISGVTYGLAVQADGKIVFSGAFTQVNGQARQRIARVHADGSLDVGFNAGATGADVLGVAVQADGKILLGGSFTQAAGTTRNRIARLEANGLLDTDLVASVDGTVFGLATQADGKILLGGSFTQVNGQARSNLARLNADGSLDAGFNPEADLMVRALAVQPDGRILLGGSFTSIAGQLRGHIARLNTDGSLDSGFDPGANGDVQTLVLQGGSILLGGAFTSVAGQTRNYIARLDASGNLDAGFNPNANQAVQTMALRTDGKIQIGGLFTSLGGVSRLRNARLNADGSLDTAFNMGFNAVVQSLAVQAGGQFLVGGSFSQIGQVDPSACVRFVRFNANGINEMPCKPSPNGAVFSIAVRANGKPVIGGGFAQVDGQAHKYVAQLNEDASLDAGFTADASASVTAVALQADGKVLVGGNFTTVGGDPHVRIARLSTSEAALQSLAVGANRSSLRWLRSGAGPELSQAEFEISSNGGASWSAPAAGQRISGGWQLNGLNLPRNVPLLVRLRGQAGGGNGSGSGSLIESVRQAYLATYAVTAAVESGQGLATPASQTIEAGDAADVTVTPASHWHVVAVSGDTCTPVDQGGGLWRAANIQAACAVKASFAIDTHTVTPSAGAHGTISPGTAQTVDHGATTAFTVTPAAGYGASVGGSCGGSLSGSTYTTNAIVADCTVQASFVQNAPAALTVQGGATQSAYVTTAFGQALRVRVADAGNVPLQGIVVNFASVPVGGASATLSATSATTDASGLASVAATANATAGSYTVNATVAGIAAPATFALTNARYDTSITLSSMPSSPAPGGTAVLTATVSSVAPGTPGGNVEFRVDGAPACANAPVNASGVATCNAGPFGVGTHGIEALYGGDAARAPASTQMSLNVVPVATTTTAVALPAAIDYGLDTAVTATVTPANVVGTVVFRDAGATISGCGSVPLANGSATCHTTRLAYGLHALTAAFVPGNGDALGSTSAAVTVNVSRATLSYVATPASVVYGNAPGSLGGSLSGFVNGEDQASAVVGTATWTTAATATSPAGTYAINGGGLTAANYQFVQAGANATALTVTAAATTIALHAAPAAPVHGQPVTLDALVALPSGNAGTALGSVAFADAGTPLAGCAAVAVSGGQAQCQSAALAAHAITVTFTPSDGNTKASTGGTDIVVGKAATTTTISNAQPWTITFGAAATVNVTVAADAPGSGTPSGTVTVSDGDAGSSDHCTIVLPATSCTLTPSGAGPKTLTAAFTPDAASGANFAGSSATAALTVERAEQATLNLAATPNVLIPGMHSQLAASGGSGSGPVSYGVDSGPCGVSGSIVTATGAGSCVVRATKAADANYNAASATATITVQAADPPVAQAQSVGVAFNTVQAIQLAGSDGNLGGPYALTYALVEAPLHGTIGHFSASSGTLTYTPDLDYVGADRLLFTVSSTNGVSQPAAVTLDVAAPQLALSIADGRDFARYGQVVDYTVTLTNTGGVANAVPVWFALSPGFDAQGTSVTCVGAIDGAICSPDPNTSLRFTVTLPPGRSLTWLVGTPVRGDAAGATVTFAASAIGANPASDTNTLVVFRDGFDVAGGDASVPLIGGERARTILDGDSREGASSATVPIVVPDRVAPPLSSVTWLIVRDAADEARVEGHAVGPAWLVRLRVRDASAVERASAWSAVEPGAALVLGAVSDDDGKRVFLLEGARESLMLH